MKEEVVIRPDNRLTRRGALTALGLAGAVPMASGPTLAATSGAQPDFESAVQALRVAMVEGDGEALNRMLHDRLIYMHSSGHSQTKQNLLSDLTGERFFLSLTYADQRLEVSDRTGVAVLTVDQIKNLAGGKTRASRIEVMQTWVISEGEWRILARLSSIISGQQTPPSSADKG